MRLLTIFAVPFCATALLFVTGCGGSGKSLNTVPVSGTVTLDGDPVEGATVTFSPEGEGNAASGTTDASGRYVLTSEIRDDGAVPGTYKVMITKFESPPQPMTNFEDADAAIAAAEAAGQDVTGVGGGRAPREAPRNLVPEKYSRLQDSGLTATVSGDGENTINFPLES